MAVDEWTLGSACPYHKGSVISLSINHIRSIIRLSSHREWPFFSGFIDFKAWWFSTRSPPMMCLYRKVLIRVHACGVNPVETYIRSGTYSRKPTLPYTPGTDVAGVVETVGDGVTSVKVWFTNFVGTKAGTDKMNKCVSQNLHKSKHPFKIDAMFVDSITEHTCIDIISFPWYSFSAVFHLVTAVDPVTRKSWGGISACTAVSCSLGDMLVKWQLQSDSME